MTIALIGLGNWGKNHLRVLKKLNLLAGVYEINPKIKNSKKYSNIVFFNKKEDIAINEKIKAVIISTPAETHYEVAKFFLKNGKHVLLEKPMCINYTDALKLHKISKKNKKILMVGHLLQYHPCVKKIFQLISQKVIGKIKYIESRRLGLGRIRKHENILWSFAPHDINLVCSIFKKFPDTIRTIGSYINNNKVADATTTHLKFGKTFVNITVSWLHYEKVHQLLIVGKKGMIIFDDLINWGKKIKLVRYKILKRDNSIKSEKKFIKVEESEPLLNQLKHFVRCINNNLEPLTSSREVIKTMKILKISTNQIK